MYSWFHQTGAVIALTVAGLAAASCSGSSSVGDLRCVMGEANACACADGNRGVQECGAGGYYLACICEESKDAATGEARDSGGNKGHDGGSTTTDDAGAGVPDAASKDAAADATTTDALSSDAQIVEAQANDAQTQDAPAVDALADDAQTKDAQTMDALATDAQTKDAQTLDASGKEAQAKDAETSDVQTKDAQGADAMDTDGNGGDSGNGGGTACPLPGETVTMIDDGSEGDTMGEILQQCDRHGYWFSFHDSGTQTPAQGAPFPIVTTDPPNGVTGYVETTGTLGSDAGLGFTLDDPGTGAANYDATQQQYTGLSFWIRSAYAPADQPQILLQVPDAETAPLQSYTTYFAIQVPAPPMGVWTKYSYAWTDLQQIDSTENGLDLKKLRAVQWELKATSNMQPYDISIGDVEFTQ